MIYGSRGAFSCLPLPLTTLPLVRVYRFPTVILADSSTTPSISLLVWSTSPSTSIGDSSSCTVSEKTLFHFPRTTDKTLSAKLTLDPVDVDSFEMKEQTNEGTTHSLLIDARKKVFVILILLLFPSRQRTRHFIRVLPIPIYSTHLTDITHSSVGLHKIQTEEMKYFFFRKDFELDKRNLI